MTWRAADAVTRAAGSCVRLRLAVRRGMGDRAGERRFPGRPQDSGIEVEALRLYAAGDDLRHLDWNAASRLDTLVTRRFTAERQVRVDLLLDASASMGVPARDGKLDAAREVAMALAWMALVEGDTVLLAALADGGVPPARTFRHRTSALRAAEWLAAMTPAGPLDLASALAEHGRRNPGPALTLVVSDLMMAPADVERGVQALRARRHAVALLHVLGPSELDPSREIASGVLADVESGDTHPIALTAELIARYDALLAEHLAAMAAAAARSDATYVRFTSDQPLADVLTARLAPLGLVRRR